MFVRCWLHDRYRTPVVGSKPKSRQEIVVREVRETSLPFDCRHIERQTFAGHEAIEVATVAALFSKFRP